MYGSCHTEMFNHVFNVIIWLQVFPSFLIACLLPSRRLLFVSNVVHAVMGDDSASWTVHCTYFLCIDLNFMLGALLRCPFWPHSHGELRVEGSSGPLDALHSDDVSDWMPSTHDDLQCWLNLTGPVGSFLFRLSSRLMCGMVKDLFSAKLLFSNKMQSNTLISNLRSFFWSLEPFRFY